MEEYVLLWKKNDWNYNNYLVGFDWDEISIIRGNFYWLYWVCNVCNKLLFLDYFNLIKFLIV